MIRIILFEIDIDKKNNAYGFELGTLQIGVTFYSILSIYKIGNTRLFEIFGIKFKI